MVFCVCSPAKSTGTFFIENSIICHMYLQIFTLKIHMFLRNIGIKTMNVKVICVCVQLYIKCLAKRQIYSNVYKYEKVFWNTNISKSCGIHVQRQCIYISAMYSISLVNMRGKIRKAKPFVT